jgi:hypothetical protein
MSHTATWPMLNALDDERRVEAVKEREFFNTGVIALAVIWFVTELCSLHKYSVANQHTTCPKYLQSPAKSFASSPPVSQNFSFAVLERDSFPTSAHIQHHLLRSPSPHDHSQTPESIEGTTSLAHFVDAADHSADIVVGADDPMSALKVAACMMQVHFGKTAMSVSLIPRTSTPEKAPNPNEGFDSVLIGCAVRSTIHFPSSTTLADSACRWELDQKSVDTPQHWDALDTALSETMAEEQ